MVMLFAPLACPLLEKRMRVGPRLMVASLPTWLELCFCQVGAITLLSQEAYSPILLGAD